MYSFSQGFKPTEPTSKMRLTNATQASNAQRRALMILGSVTVAAAAAIAAVAVEVAVGVAVGGAVKVVVVVGGGGAFSSS